MSTCGASSIATRSCIPSSCRSSKGTSDAAHERTRMLNRRGCWKKLGRILKADAGREWMATYTGPSFAKPRPVDGLVDVYMTGRDSKNRSRIGIVTIDLERPASPIAIGDDPVFDL